MAIPVRRRHNRVLSGGDCPIGRLALLMGSTPLPSPGKDIWMDDELREIARLEAVGELSAAHARAELR